MNCQKLEQLLFSNQTFQVGTSYQSNPYGVLTLLQQLKHEMEQLEGWMTLRDVQVKDKNYGDNITFVEELLRRQQDFEKTVDAQEDKFVAIKRATQVKQESVDKVF